MATRKRKTKKKSVVDSAARNAASITDGCNPEFVKGATFDGIFEMPIIKKPKKIITQTIWFHSAKWIKQKIRKGQTDHCNKINFSLFEI